MSMEGGLTQLSSSNARIDICFSERFGPDRFKLIEVSDDLLAELQTQEFEIRGIAEDEAVLCSESTTFSIKKLETSNLQLVGPLPSEDEKHDSPHSISIKSVLGCHYELSKIPPKVQFLKDLLMDSELDENSLQRLASSNESMLMDMTESQDFDDFDTDTQGDHTQSSSSSGKAQYTTNELRRVVQASNQQIELALKLQGAFLWRGRWRTLSRSLVEKVTEELLLIITQFDCDIEKMPKELCIRELSDYPREIVLHVLRVYSVDPDADLENSGTVSLCDKKFSRYLGIKTLREIRTKTKQPVPDDVFMEKWEAELGDTPDVSVLKGYAFRNMMLGGLKWSLLLESSLSLDPTHRFRQLFDAKDKWTFDELEPYLRSLMLFGHSTDLLLVKHARFVRKTIDGKKQKVYFSRIKRPK